MPIHSETFISKREFYPVSHKLSQQRKTNTNQSKWGSKLVNERNAVYALFLSFSYVSIWKVGGKAFIRQLVAQMRILQ